MLLQKIHLQNFRNLNSPTKLEFSPNFNILIGGNGSGKTSLLESIYYLALSRSFRTNQTNNLINVDHKYLWIEANYASKSNTTIKLNVFKERGSEKISKIGETLATNNEIVAFTPTQLIYDESSNLIFKGSDLRRKFVDWLAFYSSYSYRLEWREFNRVLQQRNQVLRQTKAYTMANNSRLLSNLDELFYKIATKLTASRIMIWTQFSQLLRQQLDNLELSSFASLGAEFYPGWQGDLSEQLAATRLMDLKLGFTSIGPHKADVKFTVNNGSIAKEVLSRGQGKLLSLMMIVARSIFMYQLHARNFTSVLLIDDLRAELDDANTFQVIQQLAGLQHALQIFITATDIEAIAKILPLQSSRFFTVESGHIAATAVYS